MRNQPSRVWWIGDLAVLSVCAIYAWEVFNDRSGWLWELEVLSACVLIVFGGFAWVTLRVSLAARSLGHAMDWRRDLAVTPIDISRYLSHRFLKAAIPASIGALATVPVPMYVALQASKSLENLALLLLLSWVTISAALVASLLGLSVCLLKVFSEGTTVFASLLAPLLVYLAVLTGSVIVVVVVIQLRAPVFATVTFLVVGGVSAIVGSLSVFRSSFRVACIRFLEVEEPEPTSSSNTVDGLGEL